MCFSLRSTDNAKVAGLVGMISVGVQNESCPMARLGGRTRENPRSIRIYSPAEALHTTEMHTPQRGGLCLCSASGREFTLICAPHISCLASSVKKVVVPVTSSEQQSTVTRRTIVQGAAWSIPVIATAVAAPAYAASQCIPAADASQYAYTVSMTGARNFNRDPQYTNETYRVPANTNIVLTTSFSYTGPQPLPVGTTIRVRWDDSIRQITLGQTSISGAPAGSLTSPAGVTSTNPSMTYTTTQSIPANTTITITSFARGVSYNGNPSFPVAVIELPNSCSGTTLSSRFVVNGRSQSSSATQTPGTPFWYYNIFNG